MPAVDEAAIRAAIDAGVRAALASLQEPDDAVQVVDEYPDFDEYPAVETQVSVEVPPAPSPFREAARGNVVIGHTADGDDIAPDPSGARGAVVPIGVIEEFRGNGFDPRGNGEWFARERAKDQALRRAPAWESVVKAI